MSLTDTNSRFESNNFDRNKIVNDTSHFQRENPGKEVSYIRSKNDQCFVQDKYLENKYSIRSSLQDIGKTAVFREQKNKPVPTQETYPIIARKSAVEILPRDKKVVTLQIVRRESIPRRYDDPMVQLNESSYSAKEKGADSRSGIY